MACSPNGPSVESPPTRRSIDTRCAERDLVPEKVSESVWVNFDGSEKNPKGTSSAYALRIFSRPSATSAVAFRVSMTSRECRTTSA